MADQLDCSSCYRPLSGRCAVTDLQVFVNGILADPDGWSQVTVSGGPMLHRRLCPSCTRIIRRALDGAPLAVARVT